MFGTLLPAVGATMLDIDIKSYVPLIVMLFILALVFLLFKLFHVSTKLLWRLLVNGLIGTFLLFLFNLILGVYLEMDFFKIPITWVSAVVAGTLGIPGVLLLLILKFI